MSNTSDDNSTNESLASSSNSSHSHPIVAAIKSSMLRPSALLAGATGTSSTSTAAPTAPKSFLRPASFQVDSSSATTTTASPESASNSTPTPADSATSAAADNSDNAATPAAAAAPTATSPVSAGAAAATPSSSASVATTNPFLLAMMNNSAADSETVDDDGEDRNGTSATSAAAAAAAKPTNGLAKTANLFKTANPTIPTTTSTGPTNFVFGQNVHERVTIESINNDCTSSSSASSASSSQLFAIAASTSAAAAADKAAASTPGTEATVENLTEVARQYEESRAQKRKYEEVETFTGEEAEINVMDVNCKLFAFIASNWEERGPGNLRLNDNKDRQKSPRMVFRTTGNLRVLLNTKIWPGMVVERPSQKSLRFSAIETDGQIRIFLAMARPDDISILVNQLNKRINLEKLRPVPAVVTPEPAAEAKIYLDPAVVDIQTDAEIEAIDSTSGSTKSAPEKSTVPAATATSASDDAKESVESAASAAAPTSATD